MLLNINCTNIIPNQSGLDFVANNIFINLQEFFNIMPAVFHNPDIQNKYNKKILVKRNNQILDLLYFQINIMCI